MQRVNGIMVNFLSDQEVGPDAAAELDGLRQTEEKNELQLNGSDEFSVLERAFQESDKVYRKAEAAFKAYKKRQAREPDNMQLAEILRYCGTAVQSGAANRVTSIGRSSRFRSAADKELERLEKQVQKARESRADAKRALDKFPDYIQLRAVRRRIQIILSGFPKMAREIAKDREEIHGITRARIAAIVGKLDQGIPVEEAELITEPSIYDEIRNYLARQGITDRLSFESVIFGYREEGDTANWYNHCGIRGLFPKNLVEVALGRKLKKHLAEADLTAAGDKLFGALNKESIAHEVLGLLSRRGIKSRADVLKLQRNVIAEIAAESSTGSATILFRILAGSRPRLLENSMQETLADCLFPAN